MQTFDRSGWLRLGAAVLIGPPLGLAATFMAGAFLFHRSGSPEAPGFEFHFTDVFALVFASYLGGMVPALVGGVAAFWIAVALDSRTLRFLCSTVSGVVAVYGTAITATLAGTGQFQFEPLGLLWAELVGGPAALGSTAVAEFIEYVNSRDIASRGEI